MTRRREYNEVAVTSILSARESPGASERLGFDAVVRVDAGGPYGAVVLHIGRIALRQLAKALPKLGRKLEDKEYHDQAP